MSSTQQLMPVPFYEDVVVLVGQDNEPFVAMKPIVVNMGLSWQGQHEKLIERFGSAIRAILTTGADGKQYEMTCLPLRKLPAWLYTINPSKVKPELREKIICYQEECDDALWDYWANGSATRNSAPNVTQHIALSRHRVALLKELQRTHDKTLRGALHEQLTQASSMLGLSTPALNDLGWAEPEVPSLVTEFWDLFDYLSTKPEGRRLNHSMTKEKLAINLNEVARVAGALRCKMPNLSELRRALRLSQHPRFIDSNKATYSAHSRDVESKAQIIKCWIFIAPSG